MAGVDRISALPDEVLIHILSFLTTKISVSTGVLSKRWNFLWPHIPNLDFDSRDFNAAVSFSSIVNGVMAKHKGHNIHTFRVRHRKEYGCTDSLLEGWTAFVIERKVQKLDVHLGYQVLLPECIFTCKTLVDLSLSCCGEIPTTGSDVCLPSLKKLSLEMVDYESYDSLAHMLSGSPVLEELFVESAHFRDLMVRYCISSPTLSRLVLESEGDVFGEEACMGKIDTPVLRYLKIHDRVSRSVSAGSLPYLNEADICFVDKNVNILRFHHVMEFVGKLYNVKSLTLSTGWMEVSDSVFSNSNTIKFHNLRELHLDADWRFITIFLEIADNLRSLTINAGCENLDHWMEPKPVPTCLVSHLEMVRINHFGCTHQAFNMVRYILRNAKVLRRVEIYFQIYGIDLKERSEARRIIPLFERGSESCQLAFPRNPYHLYCIR